MMMMMIMMMVMIEILITKKFNWQQSQLLKSYLQLIHLKKRKTIHSKHYLQFLSI